MKKKIKPVPSVMRVISKILIINLIIFNNIDLNKNENLKVINVSYKNKIVTDLEIAPARYEESKIIISNDSQIIKDNDNSYQTRLTSYYTDDGYGAGMITGSGLGPNNFEINENGWYTYNGKLVIATATEYLLKYGFTLSEGIRTYRYYDELVLNIDGTDYDSIVLDSCGSSMKNGRIDLFVSNENSVKDTIIEVKERRR